MSSTIAYASDIAFTGSVKLCRRGRARAKPTRGWRRTARGRRPSRRISLRSSRRRPACFSPQPMPSGQPYIQHRGGPAGFLRVLDDKTIAFVDYAGNRQYITTREPADNPKAYLFLIDYANRRRIKIWGTARVVEGDAELTAKLMPAELQSAARAGCDVHRWCMGLELPAAHSAALRGRRCGRGACGA